jgi:hypothetical protein
MPLLTIDARTVSASMGDSLHEHHRSEAYATALGLFAIAGAPVLAAFAMAIIVLIVGRLAWQPWN